jgi:hypothetical protein
LFYSAVTTVLVGAIVTAGVLVWNGDSAILENLIPTNSETADLPLINPPINLADAVGTQWNMEAGPGGSLTYGLSVINIPENAFVHPDGTPVVGKVDITYTEYHDKLDLFLSGIPMTYDSAGYTYHFETAGMFDIRGFQNGEPVLIADNKSIEVRLDGADGQDFNNYYLDEEQKRWQYISPSEPTIVDTIRYLDDLARNRKWQQVNSLAALDQEASSQLFYSTDITSGKSVHRNKNWQINISNNVLNLNVSAAARLLNETDEAVIIDIEPTKTGAVRTISWKGKELSTELDATNLDNEALGAQIMGALRTIEIEKSLEAKSQKIASSMPVEPKVLNPAKAQISLDFQPSQFPELESYKDMLFEVNVSPAEFDRGQAEKEWTNVTVKKGSARGSYVLEFVRPGDSFQVACYPVFQGEDLEAAQETFDKKYRDYEKKKADLEAEKIAKMKAWEAEQAQVKKAAAERRAQQEARLIQQVAANNTAGAITRIFAVNRFGIWNCDQPQSLPQGAVIAATYVDKEGKEIEHSIIYLVDMSKEALYNMYQGERLQFDPNVESMVWTVTNDNKLAVAYPDELQKHRKGGECDVSMTIFPDKIESAAQARDLLKPYVQ